MGLFSEHNIVAAGHLPNITSIIPNDQICFHYISKQVINILDACNKHALTHCITDLD